MTFGSHMRLASVISYIYKVLTLNRLWFEEYGLKG